MAFVQLEANQGHGRNNNMKFNTLLKLLATASTALALNAFPAFAADTIQVDKGGDITPLCGTKPTKIALIDGYGGNTWRKITLAELKDEASKCANISDIQYTDAGGDPQAYNAAINSYAAQGFNIILSFTDFGDAAIPAYKAAFEGGVTMVPYFNNLSGKVGTDYAVNPYQDSFSTGKRFAEWTGKALGGKGNVVMLGGTPSASSSTVFMNGFKDGLKGFPDLKLLDDNYIVTNWNPADAQKAVAGLIAKYPQIDAVASDYGVTSLAAVKAFEEAGIAVPAMSSIATSNEYNCKYLKAKAGGKGFKYLALDGSTGDVRFALRQAMASFQGLKTDEPLGVIPYVFGDSEAGIDPKCSDTAPPDADMSSLLPADKLNALFKQ
jgi:ribose transport system substrate-binding protein